jgi:hypothetical protein
MKNIHIDSYNNFVEAACAAKFNGFLFRGVDERASLWLAPIKEFIPHSCRVRAIAGMSALR